MSHEPVEIWTEKGRVGWVQDNTSIEAGIHMAIWESLADLHNCWTALDRDQFPHYWWMACEDKGILANHRQSIRGHTDVPCRVYSTISKRWFEGKYCTACMNYRGPCGEPDHYDDDVPQGEGYPYPERQEPTVSTNGYGEGHNHTAEMSKKNLPDIKKREGPNVYGPDHPDIRI